MNRRSFLGMAAGSLAFGSEGHASTLPIIDTHIHLYDTTRPQGVPWPSKDNAVLYRPAMPPRYRDVTRALGVVGVIEVECSPWLEDNHWVLDLAAEDTMIVGTVGHLSPGKPGFGQQLERFHRNPLFRGIRNGDLWTGNLYETLSRAEFISDLKLLAAADLELDVILDFQSNPRFIQGLIKLSDRVPNLRIVIDHLPSSQPLKDAPAYRAFMADLRKLGASPHVYAKFSEVLRHVDGRVPLDLDFYRSGLDDLYEIFGPDRAIFASNWPVSDLTETYPQLLSLVQDYFVKKGPAVSEKFFWRNSYSAYRWVKRAEGQPDPAKA